MVQSDRQSKQTYDSIPTTHPVLSLFHTHHHQPLTQCLVSSTPTTTNHSPSAQSLPHTPPPTTHPVLSLFHTRPPPTTHPVLSLFHTHHHQPLIQCSVSSTNHSPSAQSLPHTHTPPTTHPVLSLFTHTPHQPLTQCSVSSTPTHHQPLTQWLVFEQSKIPVTKLVQHLCNLAIHGEIQGHHGVVVLVVTMETLQVVQYGRLQFVFL